MEQNKFTVRFRGEKKGTFCYQVAMNCAYDICEAMADISDFNDSMVTINNKPLAYWLGC